MISDIDTMNASHKNIILVSIFAVLIAVVVHCTQQFRFYNMESNWLFLYDWSDICTKLQETGGLALVISSFLTQFFRIPYVGACVTALIYMFSGWLVYLLLRRKLPGLTTYGVSLLPVGFLFLCLENDYYCYFGHVAFLMALAANIVYVSLDDDRLRLVLGTVMTPLLYHLAGSVTIVFVAYAVIWEISDKGLKGLVSLVYPVVLLLTVWLYKRTSLVDSWEHALTPFMYYSRPSTYFFPFYAWVSVPLLLLIVLLLSYLRFNPSKDRLYAVVGCLIVLFITGNLYDKVHSRSTYRLIQEQFLAETGDWDELISTADRRQPTYLISYMNLALANKGMLVQNYGYYNPQSLSRVMLPTPNLKLGLSLQSNVYMAWDYFAAARQAAFDANLVTPGACNPRQLQILIKTNLLLGAEEIAEKYLRILDKTLFYRKWAASMRSFVGGPEFDSLSASLPKRDEYIRYDGLVGDMRDICIANPSQRIVAQFYELYQILEKEESR